MHADVVIINYASNDLCQSDCSMTSIAGGLISHRLPAHIVWHVLDNVSDSQSTLQGHHRANVHAACILLERNVSSQGTSYGQSGLKKTWSDFDAQLMVNLIWQCHNGATMAYTRDKTHLQMVSSIMRHQETGPLKRLTSHPQWFVSKYCHFFFAGNNFHHLLILYLQLVLIVYHWTLCVFACVVFKNLSTTYTSSVEVE